MKTILKSVWQKIEEFFIWSSGASYSILETVPTEKTKYFGIGGTIIFTALMASFSGGYAFFTAFKSGTLAIGFGLFWGCLIFNLDRFIVNSMYSDGKHSISLMEILTGLPRLIIAIFLGIVISTPLEIKVFESEVNFEINNIKADKKAEYLENSKLDEILINLKKEKNQIEQNINNVNQGKATASIVSDRIKSISDDEVPSLQNQLAQLSQNRNSKNGRISSIQNQANREGRSLTRNEQTQIRNEKNELNKITQNINKISTEISALKGEITQLQSNEIQSTQKALTSLKSELLQKNNEILKSINTKNNLDDYITREVGKYDGFMAKLEAFSELRKKHKTLDIAAYFIMALIIIIEIAPVFFKMMVEKGPYDDVLNRVKHEVKVRQLEIQSNINQEINTAVKIHTEKHEQKLNVELQANKEILEAISKAQQELAIVAIEKWKEEQKEILMKKNLHDIIK